MSSDKVTKQEAARMLEIEPSTAARWLRNGYLERIVLGNKWYVSLRSIRECRGAGMMWMKRGPYYDSNRELVEAYVRAQLEIAGKARKQPVSADSEGSDG